MSQSVRFVLQTVSFRQCQLTPRTCVVDRTRHHASPVTCPICAANVRTVFVRRWNPVRDRIDGVSRRKKQKSSSNHGKLTKNSLLHSKGAPVVSYASFLLFSSCNKGFVLARSSLRVKSKGFFMLAPRPVTVSNFRPGIIPWHYGGKLNF